MTKRVLYVNPIYLDANPAIDALAYGLQSILHAADIQMPVLFADFREPGMRKKYEAAIDEGVRARVEGIVIYALNPTLFGEAVAKARSGGHSRFFFLSDRAMLSMPPWCIRILTTACSWLNTWPRFYRRTVGWG